MVNLLYSECCHGQVATSRQHVLPCQWDRFVIVDHWCCLLNCILNRQDINSRLCFCILLHKLHKAIYQFSLVPRGLVICGCAHVCSELCTSLQEKDSSSLFYSKYCLGNVQFKNEVTRGLTNAVKRQQVVHGISAGTDSLSVVCLKPLQAYIHNEPLHAVLTGVHIQLRTAGLSLFEHLCANDGARRLADRTASLATHAQQTFNSLHDTNQQSIPCLNDHKLE